MTQRQKRRRRLRRIANVVAAVAAVAVFGLIGSQVVAQSQAQSCGAGHRTVAAASSQQYEIVVSAARAGNPGAMVEVAQMYRDGLGVSRDLILAHAWSKLATQMGVSAPHLDRTIAACLSQAEMRQANAKVLALLQEDDQETW